MPSPTSRTSASSLVSVNFQKRNGLEQSNWEGSYAPFNLILSHPRLLPITNSDHLERRDFHNQISKSSAAVHWTSDDQFTGSDRDGDGDIIYDDFKFSFFRIIILLCFIRRGVEASFKRSRGGGGAHRSGAAIYPRRVGTARRASAEASQGVPASRLVTTASASTSCTPPSATRGAHALAPEDGRGGGALERTRLPRQSGALQASSRSQKPCNGDRSKGGGAARVAASPPAAAKPTVSKTTTAHRSCAVTVALRRAGQSSSSCRPITTTIRRVYIARSHKCTLLVK
jgi:hypothetical protein